jgi:two-component system LytT family response regulator
MSDRLVRTLIADDEPLALERLRALLGETPWISVVGAVSDGASAVRAIDELEPDLVFLDVVMPTLSGLDVLARITHRPTIVFTTAYDRFAVAAFEARALDYLLKPFGRKRFLSALERIRESLASDAESRLGAGDDADEADDTVARGRAALDQTSPLEWLFVRERGRVTPVSVRGIVRFEGCDDYVVIHTATRRLVASLRMSDLEASLPSDFLRIHRSHIVNLAAVESFAMEEGGRFTVVLRDGTRLAVSRDRARWLRDRVI